MDRSVALEIHVPGAKEQGESGNQAKSMKEVVDGTRGSKERM